MAEAAKVRVGVRVRPLLTREVELGVPPVITHPSEKQVLVDNNAAHRFTYDHVFPVHASQRDLYASTAAQMLQPFLDGYNVTILAYGQTGSGKTYTMGSECGTTDKYDDDRRGLIPRFLYDMFINLNADVSHRLEASTMASFLEIYGEDVYDLLSDAHAPGNKRASLQVLEDKNGVFVNGLSQVPVLGWEAALDVLSQGVLNRTTASTLMNTVSSRSHAVFTITLTQTMKDDAEPDGDPQTVTSKLTFVDLAGSERLGRTGAEGQRKREGIQINQGLLALGNVVNALGDDRPEKKSVHVPYRQSKLTRLLQDALGGNSQTLFIACVSPAADSINETVAALHYANRARNIKNKVVKNTDGVREELRRLRSTAAALQLELVWEHFRLGEGGIHPELSEGGDPEATGGPAGLGLGPNLQPEEVLGREDVKAYLKGVQAKVAELVRKRQGLGTPLLLGPGLLDADHSSSSTVPCPSPPYAGVRAYPRRGVLCESRGPGGAGDARVGEGENGRNDETSGGVAEAGEAGGDGGEIYDADEGLENPEEELAVLDQLIEWQRQTGEYGDAAKEEEKRLEETDSQIREKESMLLKVRETLQGYHHMRERFEVLVGKMGELEKEKASLIATMNSEAAAAASPSPLSGVGPGKCNSSSSSVEALRERLKGVESQLVSLGAQKKKQERAVMLLQRESKKCDDLQAGLDQLRRQKVMLQKRQQEAAKRHREYEQRMSREIQAMRKKNSKDLRHMSKMELEVRRQKAAAARKDRQVGRIGDKLKRTEEHLLRLLSLRKQQSAAERLRARAGGLRRGASAKKTTAEGGKGAEHGTAGARVSANAAAIAAEASEARVAAAKHMLEEAVKSRIEQAALRQAFVAKIRTYDELTSSQVGNIGMLRDYRAQLQNIRDSAVGVAAAPAVADNELTGAENVDPGSNGRSGRQWPHGARSGKNGGRSSGSGGDGRSSSSSNHTNNNGNKGGVPIGDVDTLEGQRQFLEALVQETEKAVDETQEKLEMLSEELDDMCRRLGMGDSFQGRSTVTKGEFDSPGSVRGEGGDRGIESPGGAGGNCGVLGAREFKAVEGLTSEEARLLVTGLVDDMAASGIGDMLRREEVAVQAAEIMELRDRNKSMKDELFRLSQRYSRRMSQLKVDHTRDMVRLSMLDSVGDSTEDGGSCFGGSLSGILAECTDDDETGGPTTPVGRAGAGAGVSDRAAGLGPVAANLFASPVPTGRVNVRASWGGPRTTPRTGMPPMVPSPISSRDACEASANRRLSGQHMELVMARQRQLENVAETEGKRREKVEARNRALTQDLQRERAERQRVQARLVAAERGAEGMNAGNLSETVAALEGVWTELGVAHEQRLGLMDRVASGVLREAETLLGQARDERVSLSAKVGSLREDLHALWAMLGKSEEEEETQMKSVADKPLRNQAEKLSKLVGTASEAVCAGAARRAKLRSAASAAVKVLELEKKDIGPDLRTLLQQSRFDLPRALRDDEEMAALSVERQPDDESEDFPEGQLDSANSTPYLVGAEALEKFEKEVRKLRTMQAEALAGYHEVRDEAREAVLAMDLSAEDAFDLCKRSAEEGWVRIGDENGPRGEALDENALDYACALLCRPSTTHAHVSRSRTQHLQMAWLAIKMAMERRKSAFADAKTLVERAHRDFVAATKPPDSLEAEASVSSAETPPPAFEAFLEGLAEDFPPLARDVLEACEGELRRLREEALDLSAATQQTIIKSRATLREAGGIAAEGRASEVPLLSTLATTGARIVEAGETGGDVRATAHMALERLKPGGSPGAEEWLDEASCGIAESWESTLDAVKSLAVDAAIARALDKRVCALEGVRSSDQDICQLAQRMAELQAALEPGRLSKRNKSSTHLLDAEKNRNACQAAYMRALKRLKEQLKTWREACGCGFDPSLLSDVTREALLDLQRAGRTGAKIEHILPHLDSSSNNTNANPTTTPTEGGNTRSRATSPEIFLKPRLSQDPLSASATVPATTGKGGVSSSIAASSATPLKTPQALRSASSLGGSGVGTGMCTPPENVGVGVGDSSGASSALTSIANPGLLSSASKGLGSVQSFRGRGGAFGMLLHKVQAGQTPARAPAPSAGVLDGIDGVGGASYGHAAP